MKHIKFIFEMLWLVCVCALPTGCGPAQPDAKMADGLETSATSHPRCQTNEREFALEVLGAAKSVTPAELLIRYAMSNEQFHRFLDAETGGQMTADVEAGLIAAQLSDLTSAQQEVTACNAAELRILDVKTSDHKPTKVYVEATCGDGSQMRWKVKMVSFEQCLYMGVID